MSRKPKLAVAWPTSWLFLLIVNAAVAPCAAQAPGDTARSVVLRRAVEQGWQLRVATPRDTSVGRAASVDAASLRLVGGEVLVGDITRVERQRKHGGGALPGAVAGGAAIGGLGYLLSGLCESGCYQARAWSIAGGALTGAVLGGLVGHAVAPGRRAWDVVWPRD